MQSQILKIGLEH